MAFRRVSKPFKACRTCRALVDQNVTICPVCGSTSFTNDWDGVIVIIDVEKSTIAKILGIKKPGRYAIKIR